MNKKVCWTFFAAVAFGFLMILSLQGTVFAGSKESKTAFSGEPVEMVTGWSEGLPPLSDEQARIFAKGLNRFNLAGPMIPQTGTVQAPAEGTETWAEAINEPQVPESFVIKRQTNLQSILPSAGTASHVLEPSVSNDGKYVFYTANWFAARSTDGGKIWTYLNAYSDFPAFCCDQDTVYDPARRAMIWYRQGVADGSGNNIFKLGVSTNGGASFCTYSFAPSSVNSGWTNQWFDYPRIAMSNDYLWIATNTFNASDVWQRAVMLKMPLDALATCSGFSYSFFDVTDRFNFTPVQGATTSMYWATHNSTSSMRIYTWDESSGSIAWNDVAIPAWTSTPRGSAVCTTADAHNPCARFDDRVLSGWLANWDGYRGEKMIGFTWNVRQGGTFAMPYTNAALFKESDKSYVSSPFIWSNSGAWIYADGAPNARGDLGISVTYVSNYPHQYLAINDDYNVAPPGWEVKLATTGLAGPSDNRWGDYLRVRPLDPGRLDWAATGYILGSSGNTQPRYMVFGRERENKSFFRWNSK